MRCFNLPARELSKWKWHLLYEEMYRSYERKWNSPLSVCDGHSDIDAVKTNRCMHKIVVFIFKFYFIYFWNINYYTDLVAPASCDKQTNLLAHRCLSARNMNSKKEKKITHSQLTYTTDRVINNSTFAPNEYYINVRFVIRTILLDEHLW